MRMGWLLCAGIQRITLSIHCAADERVGWAPSLLRWNCMPSLRKNEPSAAQEATSPLMPVSGFQFGGPIHR